MDIRTCHRKKGIWDGKNKICRPPNTKIFTIIEKVRYGEFVHLIRAKDKKQAMELYGPHKDDGARLPYLEEIKQIKSKGFPRYLMHGGSKE